jgi:hypothetical protein
MARSPQPQKSQSLQSIKKDLPGFVPPPVAGRRDLRRVSLRMSAFLREYESQCGNISAACALTGISRRTYYRWMNGLAAIHIRFQSKVKKILPGEKLIDAAEHTIMKAIAEGDVTAAIFTLKTKGRSRGWGEREQSTEDDRTQINDRVVGAFIAFLNDHPEFEGNDRVTWCERFAKRAGVEPEQLAKRAGIEVQEFGGIQ